MLRHVKNAAVALSTLAIIGTAFAQGAQQDVGISATVLSTCSFDGTATPTALSTTIPIDSAGNVVTTKQTFVVTQVVCTTSTSVIAASMRGGVKSATNPGAGFTNIINYRGTARFGKANSAIDTAAIPTATGWEMGSSESTGGPQRGALIIQIAPQASALPLAGGSDYHDTLRIMLWPD